jgi:hypothetical protein
MDVKSVFLHREIFEEILIEQPPSFVTNSNLVCRLKKYIDGLKQSLRAWYDNIDIFFLRLGFKHCEHDHNLYVLHTNGNILIVVLYVDDLVIIGNKIDLILRLKKQLTESFDMTNIGTLYYFLGLQVLPLRDGFFISQFKYVMDLLTFFKMVDCKPCDTLFQLE